MATAILVDGGFYIKRYRSLYTSPSDHTPLKVAKSLHEICRRHLMQKDNPEQARDLYRIFYYDCPPLEKKQQNPISKTIVDFSASKEFYFRDGLHKELRKLRKVALRFGRLADYGTWQLKPNKLKELIDGELKIEELDENDVFFTIHQKGIDLKIGLDIASLAFKKQVDQVILIAGDSDFVPAAKLARREGIDFILDPMWNPVNDELYEHIDGLRSTCLTPKREGYPQYNMPTEELEAI
jgi:uncharacterized LabA/DUF88 family protein